MYKIKAEEAEKIFKSGKKDFISMIMDYKHGRMTSDEFFDILEKFTDHAYHLGVIRGKNEPRKIN